MSLDYKLPNQWITYDDSKYADNVKRWRCILCDTGGAWMYVARNKDIALHLESEEHLNNELMEKLGGDNGNLQKPWGRHSI